MANKFTDAVFNAKLSGMIKVVLYTLAWRADNETGVCWTSHKRLASDSGVSVRTAQRAVDYSITHKILIISGQRPSRTGPINEYTLNLEVLLSLAGETRVVTEATLNDEPSRRDYPSLAGEPSEPSLSGYENSSLELVSKKTSDKLASYPQNLISKPETPNPDTLDEAEQKMFDWAKAQPIGKNGFSWSNFTTTLKGFRNGCLSSDNFRKQYANAMKKSKGNPAYGGNGSDIAKEVPSALGTGNLAHAGGAGFLTPKPLCKKGCGRRSHSIGICWECQIADSKRFPHIIPDVGDDLEQIEKMNAELEEEMTPVQQIDVDEL